MLLRSLLSVRSNWNTDSRYITRSVKGIMGNAKEMAVTLHPDFMECAWEKKQVEDDRERNEELIWHRKGNNTAGVKLPLRPARLKGGCGVPWSEGPAIDAGH